MQPFLNVIAALLLAAVLAVAAVRPELRVGPRAESNFHGYIVLAQFECDDILCPDWSLMVTRLATECFTWNCSHEEKIEVQLVPKSPIAYMDFPVFTAYDAKTRNYFVAGITGYPAATGRLWTVNVAENFSTFALINATHFAFPSQTAQFAALEVSSVTGLPIGLYVDGTVTVINPVNGSLTTVGNILNGNATRVLTQATDVDIYNHMLMANFNDGMGNEIGFATMSLINFTVVSTVFLGPLPYNNGMSPIIFAMNWISEINNLVVFGTGNWDQLFYVDPMTGNTTYACFEIEQLISELQFCTDTPVKMDDTYKNTAYDPKGKQLYFQATVGDCTTGTTSLVMSPPFVAGPPQTIYYADIALQPLDFGYQGMHYVMCHPNCPT